MGRVGRFRVAGAAVAVLAAFAADARAAEVIPTAQAVAADAAWLAYAPPPPQPVSVCLVDTGVNLNADTSAAVVTRDALDHGTLDDVDAQEHHGTQMAMMMAAPVNGVGMVGIWPAVRVESVRISPEQPSAPGAVVAFVNYARGIEQMPRRPKPFGSAQGHRTRPRQPKRSVEHRPRKPR